MTSSRMLLLLLFVVWGGSCRSWAFPHYQPLASALRQASPTQLLFVASPEQCNQQTETTTRLAINSSSSRIILEPAIPETSSRHTTTTSRRQFADALFQRGILVPLVTTTTTLTASSATAAAPRELELGLVQITRVLYWMQALLQRLNSTDTQPAAYLEARLGAKALLTGKLGSGTTAQVYSLASFQLKGCLQDLLRYYSSQFTSSTSQPTLDTLVDNFQQDLASLVEFDGLDTLQDPSPRASLTVTQCTPQKILFVKRLVQERLLPQGTQLVQGFAPAARQRARAYIREYYASELPATGDTIV